MHRHDTSRNVHLEILQSHATHLPPNRNIPHLGKLLKSQGKRKRMLKTSIFPKRECSLTIPPNPRTYTHMILHIFACMQTYFARCVYGSQVGLINLSGRVGQQRSNLRRSLKRIVSSFGDESIPLSLILLIIESSK